MVGDVVPYRRPPTDASAAEYRASLETFLREIDVLWADVYADSGPTLRLRHQLGVRCPAILFAGGAMPKAADAMLFPWRRLLRPNDTLLFTCTGDRAIWRLLVDRSELREVVAPLAVDDSIFYPRTTSERVAIRLRYHLPPETPLLLYVGRLNVQKNLHSLLKLLAAVRRDIPDVQLCLVGEEDDIGLWEFGVPNTNYVAWLRARADELGVADAISFLGPLYSEDLADAYAAADILVNLSFYHRENFGLSQAEAQACGVPVICSAWGGFKDVVQPGETGYLVDAVLTKNGVRVDWAKGACEVVQLLRNPDRRRQMGQRATARARENFGIRGLARTLAPLVAEAATDREIRSNGVPAYIPSKFSRRFMEHKRATDWSVPIHGLRAQQAPTNEHQASVRWYPPMFRGRDYDLYESIIQPYASRLAIDLDPADIRPEWVPYYASDVVLDSVRQLARDADPVWPHQTYFLPDQWAVVSKIDGTGSVDEIVEAARIERPMMTFAEAVTTLWCLHSEGFALFRTD
jgi:glycosyltransferase involved in cell wall biosynthesis